MNKVRWEKVKHDGEILVYYDRPQLMVHGIYLSLLVDDDTWLVTSYNTSDLNDFLAGKIDLLGAIQEKSIFCWIIKENGAEVEIRKEKVDKILDSYLPISGFYYGKE